MSSFLESLTATLGTRCQQKYRKQQQAVALSIASDGREHHLLLEHRMKSDGPSLFEYGSGLEARLMEIWQVPPPSLDKSRGSSSPLCALDPGYPRVAAAQDAGSPDLKIDIARVLFRTKGTSL